MRQYQVLGTPPKVVVWSLYGNVQLSRSILKRAFHTAIMAMYHWTIANLLALARISDLLVDEHVAQHLRSARLVLFTCIHAVVSFAFVINKPGGSFWTSRKVPPVYQCSVHSFLVPTLFLPLLPPRCCSIIELQLVISSCKPLNAQEKPPSVIVVSCNKHEYKTIADAAKRRLVLLTVYMQVLAVNRERCAPGTPCSAGPDRAVRCRPWKRP